MNRGQVLYRVAELMEGRRDQFAPRSPRPRGCATAGRARSSTGAIDRWVWYAGWADKIAQVLGSSNPVAAPYFNFTIPEPTGVVGIVAPEPSSLLGPRQPPRAAARRRQHRRRPRLARRGRCRRSRSTEVLATSDVPAGVINVLTGREAELVPVLAAHEDVDALDVWGVPDDLRTDVELAAADSVKRSPAGRRARPTPASTGWTTAPASGPSGSPRTSR